MTALLVLALSNTVAATVLAGVVALVAWRVERPALLHVLWLVVLLRLVAPPLLGIPVLPAAGLTPTVTGQLALAAPAGAARAEGRPVELATVVGWSLLALWAAGSVLVVAILAIRTRRFGALLAAAHPADDALAQRVRRVAATIACPTVPRVVLLDAPISPQLWGALSAPVLILPAELVAKLGDGQLDTVVAHELAHLKRGDHRVRWLEALVVALYWWCPTMWWVCRRLHQSEEEACDAVVTAAWPQQVRDYASGLVETIKHLSLNEPWRFVAASRLARTATLERRIIAMFNPVPRRPLPPVLRFAVAVAAVVTLGLTPLLTPRASATTEGAATVADQQFSGGPITIHLESADIRDVLTTFTELTGVEILCTPEVDGQVSVNFENMRWDEALYRLLSANGLSSVREGDRLIVRRVGPAAAPEHPLVESNLDGRPVFRYLAGGNITAPVKLGCPAPPYPPAAAAAGTTGVVILEVVIGADGVVHLVDVLRGLPDGLTDAAVEAVRQWSFAPATLDGQPVAVRYTLTVRFVLQ